MHGDGAGLGGAAAPGAGPGGGDGGARLSGPRPGEPKSGRPGREFRHEFRPGKAVAGLVLLGIAAVYLGDAGGLWRTPPVAALPLLAAGLVLAGIASTVGYGIRRRAARRASAENSGDPASRSGSQAMR
ncbi:hypothetical protein [Streptomyces sp. NBC_00388]|uniref:hypothetical protein n=1 Tax=Streptomyces sp. NBC_00388 TaxID=2975735 RepID=UPI002E24DAB8